MKYTRKDRNSRPRLLFTNSWNYHSSYIDMRISFKQVFGAAAATTVAGMTVSVMGFQRLQHFTLKEMQFVFRDMFFFLYTKSPSRQ